jgi:glycosyltransferase involved in cell wall biosynthesis
VPCRNEVGYIDRCIRSVANQDWPLDRLELIVADGASDDGTRTLLDEAAKVHAWFRWIDNPERFTPRALNRGIAAAQGEVVIILGAHAELAADFVRKNIAALDAHPDAACVGGIIENVHENDVAAVISRAMKSPFGVGNARFRTGGKAGYVDTVAFGAYRRSIFDVIGMFNEDLVRNQDDELNFRLTKAGYKIYFDPDIQSKYYVRGNFSKLFMQYFQYGYWKVYVNKLHSTVTSWRQLVPFAFVLWLCLSALLAIFVPAAFPLFSMALLLWFIAAFFAALLEATPSRQLPSMMLAFLILHVAYGLGYAQGILHFLLFKRQPKSSVYNLTR